jgi:hypothetical protein
LVTALNLTETDRPLYPATGLHKAEILDLCEMINKEATEDGQVWPPILGLYKAVVVALT